MSLILCGPPACGKSTIGNMLAEKLNWTAIDTDKVLELHYRDVHEQSLSCREIYLKHGEQFFRDFEKEAIASLTGVREHIISVGGGALKDPENSRILKSIGLLIYLKASPTLLFARIQQRPLPGYLDPENIQKFFQAILEERLPVYEKVADFQVETDQLTPEAIVKNICETINSKWTRVG